MKLYKCLQGIFVTKNNLIYQLIDTNWDILINRDNHYDFLEETISKFKPVENNYLFTEILPPIQGQEIWAAGVTYLRSKEARMKEAKDSGAADFYSKVYEAERPELFFKSTAAKCVGSNDFVYMRKDSAWNVPEPELTVFVNTNGNIVAYTIGNDMSSRDIEGENPLYLPQAKCYDKAAAIGPCLYVPKEPIDQNTTISLSIFRNQNEIFTGQISISQMKRSHKELTSYLFREMSFPNGVFLMTGTCLVPPDNFTLANKDVIHISISEIGTLINTVTINNN